MARSTSAGTKDFNDKIVGEFRANEGRVSGPLEIPLFVLTRED
jgi:hypothetical protein